MKNSICTFLTVVGLVMAMTSLSGCLEQPTEDTAGSGGGKSNPKTAMVRLQFDSYSTASLWNILFIPKAHAAVSSATMCFKRLRFKFQNDLIEDDNVDVNLGEISVDSSGIILADVELLQQNYQRVEFDLESDCAGGNSLSLVNDNGSFSSTERITIKCPGSFTISSDTVVTMNIQPIMDQLNSHNGVTSLKESAEAVDCSISDVVSL